MLNDTVEYLARQFQEFISVLEVETDGWAYEADVERIILKQLLETRSYDKLDEILDRMVSYGFNFKLSHLLQELSKVNG